jgi:hypothetical protein
VDTVIAASASATAAPPAQWVRGTVESIERSDGAATLGSVPGSGAVTNGIKVRIDAASLPDVQTGGLPKLIPRKANTVCNEAGPAQDMRVASFQSITYPVSDLKSAMSKCGLEAWHSYFIRHTSIRTAAQLHQISRQDLQDMGRKANMRLDDETICRFIHAVKRGSACGRCGAPAGASACGQCGASTSRSKDIEKKSFTGCDLSAAIKPLGSAEVALRKDWVPSHLKPGSEVEVAVNVAVFLTSPELGGMDGDFLPAPASLQLSHSARPYYRAREHARHGTSCQQQQRQRAHVRGEVKRTGAWLGNSVLMEIQLSQDHIDIPDPGHSAHGGNAHTSQARWERLRDPRCIIVTNLGPDTTSSMLADAINQKLTESKESEVDNRTSSLVEKLTEMGFDAESAAVALRLAHQDQARAVTILTEQPTRVKSSYERERTRKTSSYSKLAAHRYFRGDVCIHCIEGSAIFYGEVWCHHAQQAAEVKKVMQGSTHGGRTVRVCAAMSLSPIGKVTADAPQRSMHSFDEYCNGKYTAQVLAIPGDASGACVTYVSTLNISLPEQTYSDACRRLWVASPHILMDRQVRVLGPMGESEANKSTSAPHVVNRGVLSVYAYIERNKKYLLVKDPTAELSYLVDARDRNLIPHNQCAEVPLSSALCLSPLNTFLRECSVCYTSLDHQSFANFCFREYRITGGGESIKNPRHPATVCRTCLQQHAHVALGDGKLFVPCPVEGCGRTLQTRELRDIVQAEVFATLLERIREAEEQTQKDDDGSFIDVPKCPTAGHPMIWMKPTTKENSPWACSKCKKQYKTTEARAVGPRWVCVVCDDNLCRSCHSPPIELRTCPNCRVRIEKNQGCNSMQCYRCGFKFSWQSAELVTR